MSAAEFIAKGTKGTGTGSSVNFTYMGSIVAKDMLYLLAFSVGLGTITPDASWESVATGSLPPSSPVASWQLFKKLATGAESGAEAVNRSGHSGSDLFMVQVYQMRSPFGTPKVENVSFTPSGSISSTVTWDAVTVSGIERSMLAFAINYLGTAVGAPTGYTNEAVDDDGLSTYFELNVKGNVISGGSVSVAGAGSSSGWGTIHLGMYTLPAARSFIVN